MSDFGFAGGWRALSIAPSLGESALLKYAAYVGLFFLLLTYRFADGAAGESRFYRSVLAAVILTGLLVAVIGLAERIYWNGKILWFVVPQDWGGPWIGAFPRATGSFVNPDHFANYLAMVLPLALAAIFRGLPSASLQNVILFRLTTGLVSLLIMLAIVLSQSRAAWIGAAAALILVPPFCFAGWREPVMTFGEPGRVRLSRQSSGMSRRSFATPNSIPVRPRGLFNGSKIAAGAASLMLVLALVLLTIVTIGPGGRAQTGLRVGDTIGGGDIAARATVWHDTVRMISHFPLLGVGLGSWPEIFPRYQSAPWSRFFFRQAHNDYLQFASETGLVGLVVLVWFCSLLAAKCFRAWPHYSSSERSLSIALWISIIATALHESVDFCLRVPANAFLFTLLLALAARMAIAKTEDDHPRLIGSAFAAGGVLVASTLLIVLALTQQGRAYPHDIEQPGTLAQARSQMSAHPGSAQAHLDLIRMSGARMNLDDRMVELEAAVFVSPLDPYLRDAYSQNLAMAGKESSALKQLTLSIFNSPKFETHFYLTRWIALLSVPEQRAVEQGFKDAVAAHFPGAVEALGAFDEVFGHFADASQLFLNAAGAANSPSERARLLVAGADAESRAGRIDSTEKLLRRAIDAAPFDQAAYRQLISTIYGPRRDWPAAKALIEEGVRKGVDPLQLELVLAAAAQANGNYPLAESSLLKALAFRPTYEMYIKVGRFYLESKKLDQSTVMLQNATELRPASAEGYFWLATAQEGNYQYAAADSSYARAAMLSPTQYRGAYASFRHRIDPAKADPAKADTTKVAPAN